MSKKIKIEISAKVIVLATVLLYGCQPTRPPEQLTRTVAFGNSQTIADAPIVKSSLIPLSPTSNQRPNTPDKSTVISGKPMPLSAPQERLRQIRSIVGNAKGELFEVDTARHQIKKMDLNNITKIFAGSGQPGFKDGQGTSAQFNLPLGLDIDEQGNLYVEDIGNLAVRHITPEGIVSTIRRRTPEYVPPVKDAALSNGVSGMTTGASSSNNTPLESQTTFGVNPFPGRTFRTIPALAQHQQWFCEQPFGPQWMGECNDKNQNSLFEPTECTGKPPTSGFDYPQDCPVLPIPTPAPTPVGNCTTYICPNQSEAGKCCDTNQNGTYEAEECTDKTPFNGFLTEAQRCNL